MAKKKLYDTLEFEKIEQGLGYTLIAGVDEVGRGPLAGPVVVACVIMPTDELIEGVDDSKKLSEKKREKLYPLILEKAVCYNIVCIDEKTIDEINILEATKLAMKQSIVGMQITPEVVLIDAVKLDVPMKTVSIIKGDQRSYNISCASIIAKVYRDRLMNEYAQTYPEYGFDRNKGYGTAEHINALKERGATPIHRKTFIKKFV